MVVKVGVIAPFEGVGRDLGYAILPGIKRELASVNEERSLGHYGIALVALNDDLDPGEAAAQARALVRDPDVLAVLGLWSEDTARSALPVLADAGVPVLPAVPSGELGPMTVSLCPTSRRVAAELLRGALELGVRRVVVTGPDTELRRALVESEPGLAVVSEADPYPCEAAAAADCAVIHSGDAVSAAEALRRWRASGWEGPFLGGPEMARPWFIEQAAVEAEGARAVVCGSSDVPPPGQDASLYYSAELAISAARVVLAGLQRVIADAKQPTRENVADALSFSAARQDQAWIEVRNGRWVPLHE